MPDRPMVVLFSGGLDSLIHLRWAQSQTSKIVTLYVDFCHLYARTEWNAARELSKKLNVPFEWRKFDLSDSEQDDSYIPLRNLYLLQLATIYGNDIVFGMLYNESPTDKNPRFVERMEALLNSQFHAKEYYTEDRKIRILTPFQYSTKTEMLRWFLKGTTEDREKLARETIGCYSPEGLCGKCISCFNRWVAFANCNLKMESFKYPPYEWAMEQLATGKKKRRSMTDLSTLWFKRKYIMEMITAYKTVIDQPLEVARRVYMQHSVEPFREAINASSD